MKVVRHEVARIATVLREREIEEDLDHIAALQAEVADGPEDGEDQQ
jgi:hypothetical protein